MGGDSMGKNSHPKKKKNTNILPEENPVSRAEQTPESPTLFVDSIAELAADDFAPPPPPPTLGKRLLRFARPLILVALLAVFIANIAFLTIKLMDYKRAEAVYGELADKIFYIDLSLHSDMSSARSILPHASARKMEPMADYHSGLTYVESAPIEGSASHNVKFEKMRSNLAYLKTINPDIYGYIHIEGTRISFPIVKGEDNDFYLDHAYNREYMVCGAIFADSSADDNFENNSNTVFYGHNMADGNMFNNVMLFQDEEIFNTKLIEIYTLDGIYTFEPFSIYKAVYNYAYNSMQFDSGEVFVEFCEAMQANSMFNKEMTFTPEDKIITLSTCTALDDISSYYSGRYALFAKLVKVEK